MKTPLRMEGFKYVKSSGGIEEYTLLSNGLRVLLKEDHFVPIATAMVTYHVGSRDEAVGHTGSTHILEHILFKRSKNYPPNYWLVLMNRGAEQNATTWLDRTNYYHTLPIEHLSDALGFEADRMRGALFSQEEIETERPIVLNELEFRVENEPAEQLDQELWATAYMAHPYHHPTIGWRADVENASYEGLKRFYDTFYWPNNATVTVIGDISTRDALKLVKEKFENVPRSPHPIPSIHTKELKQFGPRRVELRRAGQTNLVAIAHKSPAGLHKDTLALSILGRILGEGKTSRLHRALIDTGFAANISVREIPFRDEGIFSVYATLPPGVSHKDVEKAILKEYELIKKKGVTNDEVKRAIAHVETEVSFSRDGSSSVAGNLNEAIALGDWTFYTRFKNEIARVTAKDVKEIANKYLADDQSTTGWFVGTGQGGAAAKKKSKHLFGMCALHEKSGTHKGSVGGLHVIPKIKESKTKNGVSVITVPTDVEDAVTIVGSLLGGAWFGAKGNRTVPELLVRMLDKGTTKTHKTALAKRLEDMGASIEFSIDEYRVRFVAHSLKRYVPKVLAILAEELRSPALTPAEFAQEKKRYITDLLHESEDTATMANVAIRQALFPASHPNYRSSRKDLIAFAKRATVRDLKNFHTAYYGTDALTIAFGGDVDHAAFAKEIERVFSGWKKKEITIPSIPPVAPAHKRVETSVFIPEKGSIDVSFGNAIGISRAHKDYYPLTFGMFVLGGSFSARLMKEVREKQGLTYGIRASVAEAEDGKDGFWVVRAMFAPRLFEQGKKATLAEIEKIAHKGITEEELKARKETMKGLFTVGAGSSARLAATILSLREEGLPKEHLAEYLRIIESMTLKEVNDALKKYVSEKTLVIAAAGTMAA